LARDPCHKVANLVFRDWFVVAEEDGVGWDTARRLKMDGPEGVEAPPVGEIPQRVADCVLEDVVYLTDKDVERPCLLLLGYYHSSRLPARTSAKAIGMKSIPMKSVSIQSEERPRAMGL